MKNRKIILGMLLIIIVGGIILYLYGVMSEERMYEKAKIQS